MKKSLYLSFLLGAMAFFACTKQNISELTPSTKTCSALQASFSIDNPNGKVNEKEILLLTNQSADAVAYHWDFGNGATSALKQPTFAYDRCGNYTITLTATGVDGNTQKITREVVALCVFGGTHDAE